MSNQRTGCKYIYNNVFEDLIILSIEDDWNDKYAN